MNNWKAEFAKAKSAADLQKMEMMLQAKRDMVTQYMNASPYSPLTGMPVLWEEEVKTKPPSPLPEEHLVSAVIGFRAWNVPLFVDELRSVAKASKWKPFQRFEANCESAQCSGVSCTCGIYAFNKMDLVQNEYRAADRAKRYVYGECWLWGRVLECKMGFRAQFAYPKAFINNGAIAKRMAEVFGVELLKS